MHNLIMKHKIAMLLALLLVNVNCVIADTYSGHTALNIGQRILNEHTRSGIVDSNIDLESNSLYGISFDYRQDKWPFYFVYDIYISKNTSNFSSIEGSNEIVEDISFIGQYIGVRKYWNEPSSKWTAYLGSGISLLYAEFQEQTNQRPNRQSGSDVGIWMGGGTRYFFYENTFIGFDIRLSSSQIKIDGATRFADGLVLGLSVGRDW